MRRFTGKYTHTVDSKNRVSIPKKILEVLRQSNATAVVLTAGLDGCLFLYTPDEFDRIGEEVDAQPMGEESVRDFSRNFHSQAETCAIDRSGRLLMPEHLKRLAGLDDRVVIAGVGRRAELWEPQTWDERFEKTRTEYEAHAKDVFR